MSELMTDFAPLAALIFVGLCVVWLVWRAIRNLFGKRGPEPLDIPPPREAAEQSRREPILGAAQPAPRLNAVPDAADVLALKASIDALARQVGLLEKRLGPANTNVPAASIPRTAPTPPAPEPRVEIGEAPVIVPERRL